MQISIPQLAVSMVDGELTQWLVADGATVVEEQPLYVLATDKTESEIASPAAGTVRILGAEGQTYSVGTVIAHIE